MNDERHSTALSFGLRPSLRQWAEARALASGNGRFQLRHRHRLDQVAIDTGAA